MASDSGTSKGLLTELKTVSTVSSIPVINLALTKAHDGYEVIKNSNAIIKWYLSTTETTMNTVARITLPIVERPLKAVDGLTSMGINVLMTKVPAVNTPPEEIVSNTKTYVTETAATVGNFGLRTSNAILNNRVGLALLGTVDKVTMAADNTFGKYVPKPVDESDAPKYLPEDNNELAKSLNRLAGSLAVAGKRFMRKRRATSQINGLKKVAKLNGDQLMRNIDEIRRKTNEQECDIVELRATASNGLRLVNATDFVKDCLTEDQTNQFNAAKDDIQNVVGTLEQTSRIQDLSNEDFENLKKKIDFVRNTLMEALTSAGVNWYKLPEEKLVAAQNEMAS